MKNILVTGGAGFIGSNFVPIFLEKYPNYNIYNLDSLTYAGSLSNLSSINQHKRYTFIKGDIRDRSIIEKIFDDYNINNVIHFAAESHVDNSLLDPSIFIETNVNGTFNLMDVAYKKWMDGPNIIKPLFQSSRFHHVSTDEVYGSLGLTGLFTEKTAYSPNSPYSASKASSDMLVRSYHESYGLNVTISNCSNNYGPKQHSEKLLPTIIRKCINKESIPIYGDGKNIRDWLYVDDHCYAIDLIFHLGKSGETYNVGGENEMTNIEIAEKICNFFNDKSDTDFDYKNLITFVQDRPGHDLRYAIDSSKIQKELNWKINHDFNSCLTKTINWYFRAE